MSSLGNKIESIQNFYKNIMFHTINPHSTIKCENKESFSFVVKGHTNSGEIKLAISRGKCPEEAVNKVLEAINKQYKELGAI